MTRALNSRLARVEVALKRELRGRAVTYADLVIGITNPDHWQRCRADIAAGRAYVDDRLQKGIEALQRMQDPQGQST